MRMRRAGRRRDLTVVSTVRQGSKGRSSHLDCPEKAICKGGTEAKTTPGCLGGQHDLPLLERRMRETGQKLKLTV